VAAEGAPVLQAALAGPAGNRLGRHVQAAGDLAGGQPGSGMQAYGNSPPSGAVGAGGGSAVRRPKVAGGELPPAPGQGEVGGRARGPGQPPGGPGAAGRAADATGRSGSCVLAALVGQLGAADRAAGHDQRLGPAQPRVEVEGDAAAHRRPPPRVV
jgi:hypothetical protein